MLFLHLLRRTPDDFALLTSATSVLPLRPPGHHLNRGACSGRLGSLCPLSLTSSMGTLATRAAVVKPEDPCDVRGAQVPSLANVDTGSPERCDGGQSTAAEGKPETQQMGT